MLALEGIKILDLTWQGAGPLCTMILGDLGAEITLISPPPAAGARQLKSQPTEKSVAYQAANRNKKSILLNLKKEDGRTIFHQLASGSDVILEEFRPGVVKRLGIDYETINKINPRIIYCSVSGYGQDGPYRDLPGHDVNYISLGGALELIGEPDRPPVIPLNLLADYGAAAKDAALGILSAVIARAKTGKGQFIDISLTDSTISLLTEAALDNYFLSGAVPNRGKQTMSGAYPFYNIYKTKDNKYITIGCLEPWLWTNLCKTIDKPDLIPYNAIRARLANPADANKWPEIFSTLRQLFLTKTRDEWFDLLSPKDVPISKVCSLDEVFSDPQILHRQMLLEVEHPTEGKIKQVGIAIKMSETPGKVRSLPPMPGEQTDEILYGLGYSVEEVEEFRRQDVVASYSPPAILP